MYDVASRTIIVRSMTGENVGPSTYVVCEPRSKKESCAPFLSSRSKAPSFLTKCHTHAIYDVRDYRAKIRGGSSLKNKAPRFVYKADDTPGPTRYTARPIQWIKKKLKLDPTKPKLYACAVPYSLTVIAPSIPTKADENGYDIDKDGKIVKVPLEKETPLDINIKSQFSGEKGWKWSCRTSKRFKKNQYKTYGPGPAAYSTQIPKCRRYEEDERYREMARLLSFVPRFVEAQELKAAREKLPGPGDYDVDGKAAKIEVKSITPKPFIRSGPRFSDLKSDSPAPTKYNICDCSKMHKQFSTKCAPFGFDSPRFRRKKMECTPGPASYEIKGALKEKIDKKKNPYALCEPPFNSTSKRKLTFVADDAPCMPSSADYPEDKELPVEKSAITASVFKNMVCRFFSPADKKDHVGPAKYNVAESFDKHRERKSFTAAEVPFNFSGIRSKVPQIVPDVPCPTSYNNELGLGCMGHHFAVTPRFPCEADTPGPGAYNDLQFFLDQSTQGAIYFSLGSDIKSSFFSETTRNIIIQAFSELPFNVLWLWDLDELPNKPKNVMVKKWLPQQDILGHHNVKAFVSPGGLQSVEEAIISGVPLIGMPCVLEQYSIVRRLVKLGIAQSIDHTIMTKDQLKNIIIEVAENKKYKEAIKQVRGLYEDQPMQSLEKAVWWVEYVVRHKGAKHLQNPAVNTSWYEEFLLDVMVVVLIILCVSLCVVFLIVKVIRDLFRRL